MSANDLKDEQCLSIRLLELFIVNINDRYCKSIGALILTVQ